MKGITNPGYAMPTVMRVGPYRLFFYSGDRNERPHVHVERDGCVAKYWLTPVRLAKAGGFHRAELTRLHQLIDDNRASLIEGWNEHFGQ